jgi:O-antigen/teichoic acid export membrane protein
LVIDKRLKDGSRFKKRYDMSLSPTLFLGARFGALTSLFNTLDVLTPEGRARERQRRIALSALASALAKAISVSTALISVPLTLNYLGAERYGMWMTMSSLIAMLSFADLGIGNGLLTSVASAHGQDDRGEIRAYVSSAYFILSAIAIAVLCLFFLCYPFVDWFRIFNVNTALAKREAAPMVAVFLTCFAASIPISIVQRVQMGLQRGFMASLWQCAASLTALAGVLIAIHFEASLPLLIFAFLGAPLVAGVLNSSMFFLLLQRDIAPARRAISFRAVRVVAKTGVLFLVLQIVGALAYSSDNIILAQMLGSNAVAEYAVPEKLFSLISTVIVMALAPLWPAYGEAITRGDRDWVRKILKRSLFLAIGISACCSLFLVVAGSSIISRWVGHIITPSLFLLVGLGVWKVLESGGNALAVFLNGARIIKFQVVVSILTAISAVALKVLFISRFGLAGVVWATICSFTIFTIVPASLYIKTILRDFR